MAGLNLKGEAGTEVSRRSRSSYAVDLNLGHVRLRLLTVLLLPYKRPTPEKED